MAINISHALDLIEANHQKNTFDKKPTELYEPRNYIMSQGGKRIRSLFCLMGYSLYKPDIEAVCDLAYMIELFHNFTLVHDDIMDEASLRRGQPAVHQQFDTNKAILSGDVMLIEVFSRITELDLNHQNKILKIITETAREVCEGQSYDMSFENRDDVTIPEYLEMIELKTAVLLAASLQLGALYAGASETDQNHLYKFALNAGISFQLQDDYLDVYGDAKTFGKKVGGDIIQCKKTYLYLRAIELMHDDDRTHFINLYQDTSIEDTDKVNRVRNIFNELYLPNYCEEAKASFFNLALSHLDFVKIPKENKEVLISFAKKLVDRSA